MQYDTEKFINAVLLFGNNVSPNSYGITKLNKLLYYSDFMHYKFYGRPILGDSYISLKQGPVPNTSYTLFNDNFKNKIDDSLKEAIKVESGEYRGKRIERIVPLKEPDPSVFSKSEIGIMKKIAKKYYKSTATSMIKELHRPGTPWSKTEGNQEIDYKLVLDKSEHSISRDYAEYWEKENQQLKELFAV